jgi:hypothetical protein
MVVTHLQRWLTPHKAGLFRLRQAGLPRTWPRRPRGFFVLCPRSAVLSPEACGHIGTEVVLVGASDLGDDTLALLRRGSSFVRGLLARERV